MRGLSICSGMGGLDIAMQAARVETVGYVEIEPYAQAVLLTRMRGGWLDRAPIWPDLTTLTEPIVRSRIGGIDCLYGGIPCQPHSTAGKRKGSGDNRDLWPATRRLIGEVRPAIVFLENVDGIRLRVGDQPAYAWRITADLASMGYVGRWVVVSAAEAGAPHRRNRWFCLAVARCASDERWGEGRDDTDTTGAGEGQTRERQRIRAAADNGLSDVAHARHDGGTKPQQQQGERPNVADGGGDVGPMADALRGGHDGRASEQERRPQGRTAVEGTGEGVGNTQEPRCSGTQSEVRRQVVGLAPFPPGPNDRAAWATIIARWPHVAPAIELPVRGGPAGLALGLERHRRQRLEGLGNGVVPQQALLALRLLGWPMEDAR